MPSGRKCCGTQPRSVGGKPQPAFSTFRRFNSIMVVVRPVSFTALLKLSAAIINRHVLCQYVAAIALARSLFVIGRARKFVEVGGGSKKRTKSPRPLLRRTGGRVLIRRIV